MPVSSQVVVAVYARISTLTAAEHDSGPVPKSRIRRVGLPSSILYMVSSLPLLHLGKQSAQSVTMLPLKDLLGVHTFRLDALGIVTLLGAEEVNHALGRLVRNRWFENMPLLGAYVIAGDRISDPVGDPVGDLELRNLTRGVKTRTFAPWFARWLMSQSRAFPAKGALVRMSLEGKAPTKLEDIYAASITLTTCSALVVLATLEGDWWGLVNALAILMSTLVRAFVVKAHKESLDRWIDGETGSNKKMFEGELDKNLIITGQSKVIALMIPRGLGPPASALLTSLPPGSQWTFTLVQAIAWTAFAVHVIAVGMSRFIVQLYTNLWAFVVN